MPIAFDAATSGGSTTGTSLTYAHTVTGVDTGLVVVTCGSTSADKITGVTYNGVALTKVTSRQATGDRWLSVFQMVGAATGANNVVVTSSSSDYIASAAASYTGVAQSGQPDASASGENSGNRTQNLTTIAANCWMVMFGYSTSTGTVGAGSGSTSRVSSGSYGTLLDSNAALAAGSNSMSVTGAGNVNTIALSFAPFAPANTMTPGFFGAMM